MASNSKPPGTTSAHSAPRPPRMRAIPLSAPKTESANASAEKLEMSTADAAAPFRGEQQFLPGESSNTATSEGPVGLVDDLIAWQDQAISKLSDSHEELCASEEHNGDIHDHGRHAIADTLRECRAKLGLLKIEMRDWQQKIAKGMNVHECKCSFAKEKRTPESTEHGHSTLNPEVREAIKKTALKAVEEAAGYAQMRAARDRYESMMADHAGLEQRVSDLESTISQLQETISQLQETISQLRKDSNSSAEQPRPDFAGPMEFFETKPQKHADYFVLRAADRYVRLSRDSVFGTWYTKVTDVMQDVVKRVGKSEDKILRTSQFSRRQFAKVGKCIKKLEYLHTSQNNRHLHANGVLAGKPVENLEGGIVADQIIDATKVFDTAEAAEEKEGAAEEGGAAEKKKADEVS